MIQYLSQSWCVVCSAAKYNDAKRDTNIIESNSLAQKYFFKWVSQDRRVEPTSRA
jgi:hypothetical protein